MSRKPRSFDVTNDGTSQTPQEPRKPRALPAEDILTFQSDDHAQRAPLHVAPLTSRAPQKGFGWLALFWGALLALASLSVGLWIEGLVQELLARESWLGWLAILLTGFVIVSASAIALHEIRALRRLTVLDDLRERSAKALLSKNREEAVAISSEVQSLYQWRADLAAPLKELATHQDEIIDAADFLMLTERELLRPLDQQSRGLIMASAKRVSVVTAVSPRALVDVAYVLLENTRLIRRIGELYGARPGALGFWRLARKVVGHLAVTGTLAVGDGLVQGLVGHGIAAKVSTRLGEGVVNGVLTARIGIAAMEVCRPLVFSESHRPNVAEFLGELTPWSGEPKKYK